MLERLRLSRSGSHYTGEAASRMSRRAALAPTAANISAVEGSME
jgi:hypothetical protein